jgi:hypothetical protein
MRAKRGAYSVLVKKTEGRRPLGRPQPKLEDNSNMDLQEVGWVYGLDVSGLGYGKGSGLLYMQ